MPTQIFEVDTGDRILEVEGDRPPTREEVERYLGQGPKPANALTEYAKPEEQKQREALAGADAILAAEYPNAGITAAAPQPGDITTTGQALAKVGKQAAMDVAPTALRVGVPIGAALLSGGAALPVAAAFTGTGALLGEEAARTVEGSTGSTPVEAMQTFAMGATMAPLKVAPGVARTVIGGALEGSAMATQGTGEMPWSKEGAVGAGLDIGARLLENRFLRRAGQLAATPATKAAGETVEAVPGPVAPAANLSGESGRIDPRILAPIARATAGFTAGALQGDTPEEKIGYGVTYATAGLMASPALAKRAGRYLATETKLGRNWAPEVTLAPFMETIRQSRRDYDALLAFPKAAKDKLAGALKTYADPVKREEANKLVYEYLTGQRHITTLPTDLAEAAQDARKAIDDLSDELITSGAATGKLRDSIVANMGSYLRRSYRLFTDRNFRPNQATFDKWVDANVADALADPANTKTAAELREGYTKTAHDLLDRNTAEAFLLGDRTTLDARIFKPRKALDGLTRELLGEVKDPQLLLSDTAPRMARNAAVFTMQKQMVDLGEKLGVFTRTPTPEAGRWVAMASEDAPHTAFAGVYASPEFREAFESISKQEASKLLQSFAAISAAAKVGKTLGSLKGYSSNLWGGGMDVVAQGHALQFGNLDSWRTARSNAAIALGIADKAGALDRSKALKTYQEMVKAGLINKSVSGTDFIRTFEQGPAALTKGVIGRAVDKASRVYMLPETVSKALNLAGELKALREAFPQAQESELFKQAAAKVRGTTSDYDYLPKAVRQLSLYGALDPFIAYTADRFRVVYNTYKLGMEEIQSGNPVLASRGRKRVAAMTATLGAAGALGVNSHLSPDQEDALRRRLPDRDRNGFLRFSEVKPDGSFTYQNLNYTIPQSIVIEAAMAATRGEDPQTAAGNFMQSVGQQLFGANLVYGPVADVARNATESGRKVRSPNDPLAKQVLDSAGYLASEMFMPLAVSEMRKAYNLTKERATEAGIKYTQADLALSNFAGIRVYRRDLDETFRGDAARLRRAMTDDQTAYSSAKRRALTEEDKQAAYNLWESRRQTVHEEASKMVADARALGASDDKVVALLKDGGIPSRMIAGALAGIYVPSARDEALSPADVLEQWQLAGTTTPEAIRAKVETLAQEDPALARRVMALARSQSRQAAAGIGSADKLLEAFDDGERAQFLAARYRQLSETEGRDQAVAYLKRLRSQRILTPPVQALLFEELSKGG